VRDIRDQGPGIRKEKPRINTEGTEEAHRVQREEDLASNLNIGGGEHVECRKDDGVCSDEGL
jgi:hypothetical protein